MMIVAAAGLALANTAATLSAGDRGALCGRDPERRRASLDALVAAVRSRARRGVGRGGAGERHAPDARALARARRRKAPTCRCRRWSISTCGPARDLAAIAAAGPGGRARRADHRPSRQHRRRCSVRCALLQWLAFGLVVLLSAAAAAAVVLAARGALDTHRFTIEVMHGIGATDLQVTHLFQRKIAIDALAGSLAGAIAGGARAARCLPAARPSPAS